MGGARRPEAAEKFPDARRVAPIRACVSWQRVCGARTPNYWIYWFCLHSALFTCTTLIINALQSVGKSAFCLHTTCTCLQSFYTYLHLLALLSALLTLYLHLLALACTLSTLTCTRFHFIYTYLHSLTLCLHSLVRLFTGISTHIF